MTPDKDALRALLHERIRQAAILRTETVHLRAQDARDMADALAAAEAAPPLHPDDGHEHNFGCRLCGVDIFDAMYEPAEAAPLDVERPDDARWVAALRDTPLYQCGHWLGGERICMLPHGHERHTDEFARAYTAEEPE